MVPKRPASVVTIALSNIVTEASCFGIARTYQPSADSCSHYALNSPLNFTDPWGLAIKEARMNKRLDNLQLTLDAVGVAGDAVPVIGNLIAAGCDLVNAIIYLGRGDTANAALSGAAILPYAGTAIKGGGYIASGAIFAAKYSDEAGDIGSGVNKAWKNKIIGKAHGTTPGHKFRSNREAIRMAKSGDYEKVYLNRGYNSIDGVDVSPNRRPDVMGIRNTGQVDSVEVMSKTDNFDNLMQRNIDVMNQLPPDMRGNVDVVRPH